MRETLAIGSEGLREGERDQREKERGIGRWETQIEIEIERLCVCLYQFPVQYGCFLKITGPVFLQ